MTTIPVATLIQSLVALLTEAYAGPPDPHSTWFIDNQPDSGILGVLAGVTAAEASVSVDGSGNTGTTIAANVEHLRWSLHNVNNTIRGQAWDTNWDLSWVLMNASEEQWDDLRQSLRAEFETLRSLLNQQTQMPSEFVTGMIALLPHAAYHLGTIRQMLERVRA